MVEIIPEPNLNIDSDLFLKELSKVADGIKFKIIKISDAMQSNRDKKKDYISVNLLILGEFKGKVYLNDDGTVNDELIDLTNDIIRVSFTLGELDETKNYNVYQRSNLFQILNYGMKKAGMIPINNNKSFRCNYDEIKTALMDLTFIGTAKLIKSKDFNDYYRLEILR